MSKLTPLKAIRKKCLDCCCQQTLRPESAHAPNAPYLPTGWEKDQKVKKISRTAVKMKKYARSYGFICIDSN